MSPTATSPILNRYKIIHSIGVGGMGVVYDAYDRLNRMQVALKSLSLNPHEMTFNSRTSEQDLGLALANEFRTLARLRHPHIISVLNFGFDRQPFFTMSLLQNTQTITNAAYNADLVTKKRLVLETLQALQYLHRHGILHRDLKPNNVIVTAEQKVVVLDFGLAIEIKKASQLAGTLAYMAPEIIMGAAPTMASDLYALGLIAFELFTGRFPYEYDGIKQLYDNILHANIDVEQANIPIELQGVIAQMLAKDPQNRHHEITPQLLSHFQDNENALEPVIIRESYLKAARFVGRHSELRQLQTLLTQTVTTSHGTICLIGGESGVGKSRLIEELRIRALVKRVQVAKGQAINEQRVPYRLFRPILLHMCLYASLTKSDASILSTILPTLDEILGYSISPPPPLEPQSIRERLLIIIKMIIEQQTQPWLLLLEDLQWATDEDMRLLQQLTSTINTLPILIIGSYRDDEAPNLPQTLPQVEVINLPRLQSKEITNLSISMLGQRGDDPQLVQLLSEQTEGNVFFIVETIRTLADEVGHLDSIPYMNLPAQVTSQGIQSILHKRLASIPNEAYPLVEHAALAGRELQLPLLATLAPQTDIDLWLQKCASVFQITDESWQFAHDKIREMVVDSIQNPQSIHREIALGWERITPEPRNRATTLAYHWGQAGDLAKERVFAELAGHQVLQTGAYHNALHYFQRALELTDSSQLLPRAKLLNMIAEIQLNVGKTQEALELQYQALHLLNNPLDPNHLYSWYLFTTIIRQIAHRLLPMFPPQKTGPQGDSILLQGTILSHLTLTYSIRLYNPKQTRLHSLNTVNTLEQTTVSIQLAEAYYLIAYGMQQGGWKKLAHIYLRLGEHAFNQLTLEVSLDSYLTLVYKGMAELSAGKLDQAKQTSTQGIAMLEVWQTTLWYRFLPYPTLALTLRFTGDFAGSMRAAEQQIQISITPNRFTLGLSGGYALLAQAALRLHNLEQTIQALEERRNLRDDLEDDGQSSTFAPYDLLLAWRQGDIAQVKRLLPQAVQEIETQTVQLTVHEYTAIFNTFEVCTQLWEWDETLVPNIAELTHQTHKIAQLYVRHYLLGRPRYFIWEGLHTYLLGKPRRAKQLWQNALQEAEKMGAVYDHTLAEYYLARYITQDVAALEKVHRTFEELGTVWEIKHFRV